MFFECWTSTAAIARDTTHIRIGQMVTCKFRNPALLLPDAYMSGITGDGSRAGPDSKTSSRSIGRRGCIEVIKEPYRSKSQCLRFLRNTNMFSYASTGSTTPLPILVEA